MTYAAGLQPNRLIRRAQRGDRGAFVELYDIYRTPIFRYLAYQVGGNIELAQDLCEEVFLQALRELRSYSPASSYVAWLYQLANIRLRRRALLRPSATGTWITTAGHGREDDMGEGQRSIHKVVG